MLPVISALAPCVVGLFRSRASLHLEHLALRHQLAVYQRSVPRPLSSAKIDVWAKFAHTSLSKSPRYHTARIPDRW
jgi:hypothetical protein